MKRPVPLRILPDDAALGARDGWVVFEQSDFRGCETQAILPAISQRNQLLRMENILLFTNGLLSAFFQIDQELIINANPGVALQLVYGSLYNYYFASGSGSVKSGILDTSSSNTYDVSTGTTHTVTGAYIEGVQIPVEFLGKLYVPNPNPDTTHNGVLNLSDMSLITITGKTTTKLRRYSNRLWAINSDGTIQISDNGDASTWDPLNIIWLPNQEPTLDFIPVQGGAIVYGANSIYAMYGSSYLDITFVPLMLGKQFTSGNADVNGQIYILSTEGIYETSLNGAQLLPHNQQDFFRSIFPVLTNYPNGLIGMYLEKFHAIVYTWSIFQGGTQALVYYIGLNGYSKANALLPNGFGYAAAVNDSATDMLLASRQGVFVKSQYPANRLSSVKPPVLQTRHEDADSTRQKRWLEFGIFMLNSNFGVNIDAYLDYSSTPIRIATEAVLTQGDNIFNLDAAEGLTAGQTFPASKTLSLKLSFNNQGIITTYMVDETNGIQLVDEDTLALLTFESLPSNFIIQSMRLKFSMFGPNI